MLTKRLLGCVRYSLQTSTSIVIRAGHTPQLWRQIWHSFRPKNSRQSHFLEKLCRTFIFLLRGAKIFRILAWLVSLKSATTELQYSDMSKILFFSFFYYAILMLRCRVSQHLTVVACPALLNRKWAPAFFLFKLSLNKTSLAELLDVKERKKERKKAYKTRTAIGLIWKQTLNIRTPGINCARTIWAGIKTIG